MPPCVVRATASAGPLRIEEHRKSSHGHCHLRTTEYQNAQKSEQPSSIRVVLRRDECVTRGADPNAVERRARRQRESRYDRKHPPRSRDPERRKPTKPAERVFSFLGRRRYASAPYHPSARWKKSQLRQQGGQPSLSGGSPRSRSRSALHFWRISGVAAFQVKRRMSSSQRRRCRVVLAANRASISSETT